METISMFEREIEKELKLLLSNRGLKWKDLKVWETSDGYLVEVRTSDVKDNLEAIKLSDQLEKELKFLGVSVAIIPL
jgi:AAA+ ATPase superfamily predicted ATPase